jgi:hypothetical protein
MSNDKKDNVVKLSEARKRQQTLYRKGASTGKSKVGGGFGKKQGAPQSSKFWTYLQFVLFMGMFAFVMSTCGG